MAIHMARLLKYRPFTNINTMKTNLPYALRLLFLLLLPFTAFTTDTWTQLNGPYGYFSPQTQLCYQGAVYVSSNTNGGTGFTGVWKTTNNGASWTDVSAGLPTPFAGFMAGHNNLIFAGCDTGIYVSSNQGVTWTIADNGIPNFTIITHLFSHQGDLFAAVYYGTGNTELFKSSNNGAGWTSTGYTFPFSGSPNDFYSNGNNLWAATSGMSLIKSTDGGVTFNYAANNIPFNASISSVIATGDTAYCGTSNGSYITTNGGQLWTLITNIVLGNTLYTLSWAINGNTVYAGFSNFGVYSSPLGQANFSQTGTNYPPNSVEWALGISGNELIANTVEGIYGMPFSSGVWTPRNNSLKNARTHVAWVEGSNILAGVGSYTGLYRSIDGGNNWAATSRVNSSEIYQRAIKVGNKILLASSNNVYTSTDDGQTWQSPSAGPFANNQVMTYANQIIGCGGHDVLSSTDEGQTWSIFSTGIPTNVTVYSVGTKGSEAYAGTNGGLFRYTPGGTWTNFGQGIQTNGLIKDIVTIGDILIVNNTYGIYRRLPSQSSWLQVSPSYYNNIIYHKGYLFAAASIGARFSDDLGTTWNDWNTGFPATYVDLENLFAYGDTLYAGTLSASVWKRGVSPELTITSAPTGTLCTGTTIFVTAVNQLTPDSTNKYYLQLSDSNGYFIHPAYLDTLTSSATTVTLSGTIPDTIITGTHYRLRIISSMPYALVADNGTDITIRQRPTIGLQPANQSTCDGEATGFYVGASGFQLSYQWQVDQTLSGNYTNLTAGSVYQNVNDPLLLLLSVNTAMSNYRYRCVITGPCGTINSNFGILSVGTSTATVSTQPQDVTICSGSSASFSVVATGISFYQWQVDNGFGSYVNINNNSQYTGANTPTLTLNFTTGNEDGFKYRCKLSTCSFSNEGILTVNAAAAAGAVPPTLQYCPGSSFAISGPPAGAGLNYQWYVDNGSGFTLLSNGGNYQGVNSRTLTLLNIPGTFSNYQYQCTITAQCFPTVVNSGICTIQSISAPVITTQPANVTICAGLDTSLNIITSGTTLGYQWEYNNGTGWVAVPDSAPFSGIFSSTLHIDSISTNINGYWFRCMLSGCAYSDSAKIQVLNNPTIFAPDISLCLNQLPFQLNICTPASGIYYGNGIYQSEFNPTPPLTGIYQYDYFYTATSGCSNHAGGQILLENCTGMDAVQTDLTALQLYPNPADQVLHVNWNEPITTKGKLLIYSIEGKIVYTTSLYRGSTAVEIPVHELANGLYLLQLQNADHRSTKKLIIRH